MPNKIAPGEMKAEASESKTALVEGALTEPAEAGVHIRFRSLSEALLSAPGSQPFITMWYGEERVETETFGEFVKRARSHAALLRARKVGRGDRVILIMPQGISLMAVFAGCMLLGAVPSILAYPNFKVEGAKYRSGLAGVSGNLKARVLVLDEAFPEHLLRHITLDDGTEILRVSENPVSPSEFQAVESEPGDLAFIQHSAGTTGLQKGVALTHASVLRQLRHLAEALKISRDDRIYSWLPLYHDMGLIACFMLPLVCHLPVVMQSPTSWVLQPGTMLRLTSEYRCTLAWVPNFALQFLARRVPPAERRDYDLSSLRAMINCSEPVRAASEDEFRSIYVAQGLKPTALQSSYAMAETVFAVTQSAIDGRSSPRRVRVEAESFRKDHVARPVADSTPGAEAATLSFVSSGRCLPGSEVRIVSPSGDLLPEGGVGEILIRSDSMFEGYYSRPDLTAEALQDGWYRSGDLGFCLDGEIYVAGRQRDLIIVAGRNIYPQDVEEIAGTHPALHDGRAVAFGLYNPDLGTEEIVVVAELEHNGDLENSSAIEQEIRSAIVAELGVTVRAVYLKPHRWIVKSTAGKLARTATREKLFAELTRTAARTAADGIA